jgi:uncharacterized protein (DUF1697 family)
MPLLIALWRGVNVGGNVLKRERLREICAKLGAKNPRTYVQSGTIKAGAGAASPKPSG